MLESKVQCVKWIFHLIETLGVYVGKDISGLAAFVTQLVVSQTNYGKAKMHVFGSSVDCRGAKLTNSCLRIGNHGTCIDII